MDIGAVNEKEEDARAARAEVEGKNVVPGFNMEAKGEIEGVPLDLNTDVGSCVPVFSTPDGKFSAVDAHCSNSPRA